LRRGHAAAIRVDESTGTVFFDVAGLTQRSRSRQTNFYLEKSFFNMQKKHLLPLLTGAALLCGCDRQTRLNTEKIELLSQKMVQLQESQARQMAVFQAELTQLAPMMDKMNGIYFEKTHDDALFFHTNTLFLMLTVDKKIESQLQVADTERAADGALAYAYHTNEMDMLHFYHTQLQDALTAQEKSIEDEIAAAHAGTRQLATNLSDELSREIKLSAPDAAETARWQQMEADVAQMRQDLAALKAQLGQPSVPPPARP
jgi:hypothetical protein